MYIIKDLQGTDFYEGMEFESLEDVKKELVRLHEQDYTGEVPLSQWTLEELCDYGCWEIIKK